MWQVASTSGREVSQYLAGELAALEREQAQIDAQAAKLEKRLRRVMEAGETRAVTQTGHGGR